MAKCERREIKPEPPPVEFVLTLTKDEAMALWYCLNGTRCGPATEQIRIALMTTVKP